MLSPNEVQELIDSICPVCEQRVIEIHGLCRICWDYQRPNQSLIFDIPTEHSDREILDAKMDLINPFRNDPVEEF